MDYIETFKNLKTNNKWGRKAPHKAVLMLTVIELYEKNILMDNEIRYDETLKSTFLNIWNSVLPDEPLFHPEAYLPFWYLQSDNFWHIVPIRGKEDILSLMRDTNIKPSEAKLIDSVKYAELDEDLYFLMTLPSGRSSLKRVLLETYTTLSNKRIEKLAESKDNTIDYSATALSDYERILLKDKDEVKKVSTKVDNELVSKFLCLNEDVQLTLNIVYFTFLKRHRNERDIFKDVCPTVYDLLDKIVNHPIKQGEIAPSFAFVYDNFLSDLKVSLLSEDGSIELVDKIGEAIKILRGNNNIGENDESIEGSIEPKQTLNKKEKSEEIAISTDYSISFVIPERDFATENRKGKPWTEEEEKHLQRYFQQGIDIKTIAEIIGRTKVAIKSRLAKLGLINYVYGQEEPIEKVEKTSNVKDKENDFTIENSFSKCSILNKYDEKVFSAEGKLKYIREKLYRLNLKSECFTLKSMIFDGSVWLKGEKKVVAYPRTELYKILDEAIDYCDEVEDIVDCPVFENCRIKVKGVWYKYNGELFTNSLNQNENVDEKQKNESDRMKIMKSPLYAVRKQAVLRAMGYFRLPAKIKDITRTISRSAWGSIIKEDDVEKIIKTISEVESIDGKYILRKK